MERFGDNNPKHEKWTNHRMADKEKTSAKQRFGISSTDLTSATLDTKNSSLATHTNPTVFYKPLSIKVNSKMLILFIWYVQINRTFWDFLT